MKRRFDARGGDKVKTIELSQEDIDVLWSAVINQQSVESVLCNSAKDINEYNRHRNRLRQSKELQNRIRRLGVTGIPGSIF